MQEIINQYVKDVIDIFTSIIIIYDEGNILKFIYVSIAMIYMIYIVIKEIVSKKKEE